MGKRVYQITFQRERTTYAIDRGTYFVLADSEDEARRLGDKRIEDGDLEDDENIGWNTNYDACEEDEEVEVGAVEKLTLGLIADLLQCSDHFLEELQEQLDRGGKGNWLEEQFRQLLLERDCRQRKGHRVAFEETKARG